MHDTLVMTWRRHAELGLEPTVARLFRSYLLWNLGFALYATVSTLYLRQIGASYDQIGVVLGGAAVGRTLLSIPAGFLTDRISPALILATTMALPVVGMAGLLVSTAWWRALVAVLMVELSGLGIPALSTLLAAAPAETRSRAFTWLYTVAPQSALLVGPALSGLLADTVGFEVVFVVAAACFMAGVALLVPLLWVGTGVAGVVPVPAGGLASVVQGAPASDGEAVSPDRGTGTVRTALSEPGVRFVVLLHVLVPLLPYIGFILLASFLVEERGVSVATVGLFGSVSAGAAIAVGLMLGRWRRFSDPFAGLAFCLGCGAVALGLIWLSGPVVVLLAAVVLRGALSPVFALLSVAVAQVTPPQLRGRVFCVAETGAGVGDIGAPVLTGGLYGVNSILPVLAGIVTTIPLAVWVALSSGRFRAAKDSDRRR